MDKNHENYPSIHLSDKLLTATNRSCIPYENSSKYNQQIHTPKKEQKKYKKYHQHLQPYNILKKQKMTLKEETTCIATPGFAGFVPSLKYQFGLTYGNATRHILHTDPSLKQGQIQVEHQKKLVELKQERARERERVLVGNQSGGNAGGEVGQGAAANGKNGGGQSYVWKRGNKFATSDDRFSFPPVPGYTGKEHVFSLYVDRSG
jgi:hypothetical protein